MKIATTLSVLAALCLAACSSSGSAGSGEAAARGADGAGRPRQLRAARTRPGQAGATPAPAPAAAPFDQTLELQGVTFQVKCPNASSMNKLTIVPSGLTGDNAPIVQEVDGIVTGAEVADINSDGSPEVYVYVQSAGSGSYGSVVAYSSNKKKSLSMIYLPPVSENPKASKGYMGHDAFAVVGDPLRPAVPGLQARRHQRVAHRRDAAAPLQARPRRGRVGPEARQDRGVLSHGK